MAHGDQGLQVFHGGARIRPPENCLISGVRHHALSLAAPLQEVKNHDPSILLLSQVSDGYCCAMAWSESALVPRQEKRLCQRLERRHCGQQHHGTYAVSSHFSPRRVDRVCMP